MAGELGDTLVVDADIVEEFLPAGEQLVAVHGGVLARPGRERGGLAGLGGEVAELGGE